MCTKQENYEFAFLGLEKGSIDKKMWWYTTNKLRTCMVTSQAFTYFEQTDQNIKVIPYN